MHEAIGTHETECELLHRNPSRHLLERALPCELVQAHRRTVFYLWTCGYRRGATAVAVALEDDPRLLKESDWLLEETIDYDHFIDVLYVESGCSNSSSAALRVWW